MLASAEEIEVKVEVKEDGEERSGRWRADEHDRRGVDLKPRSLSRLERRPSFFLAMYTLL